MPPKKKGKKGGKNKGKVADDTEPTERAKTPEPTEKEILLQEELDKVTEELQRAKAGVDDLRKENEWLQQEAHKVRIESHEYMSYMEKKTSKRQTTIITLSDHNKQEIKNIQLQKQIMEEEYDEKKEGLKGLLLEKQHLLEKTTQELDDLQEYKDLQTEQLTKIKELEKEVMQMRAKHSETIQHLKTQFLREKKDFQQDSDTRIYTLEKKANKEAVQCLTDHTNSIKLENRRLRKALLDLIRKTRALNYHLNELEEQKKTLIREQQYSQDLKKLRNARQHKVYKAFGMLENENDIEADDMGTTNDIDINSDET